MNRHRNRIWPFSSLSVVESLEPRWLLSGVVPRSSIAMEPPPAAASVPSESAPVELLALVTAAADRDVDPEIDTADLPRAVVAAVRARLPGAKMLSADASIDDGGFVYDVSTKFKGSQIDLSIFPDGTILKIDRAVAPLKLPPPVLDWVRHNFPGATIDEAQFVTEGTAERFELLLAGAGQPAIEATLRVSGSAVSEPPARPETDFNNVEFAADAGARTASTADRSSTSDRYARSSELPAGETRTDEPTAHGEPAEAVTAIVPPHPRADSSLAAATASAGDDTELPLDPARPEDPARISARAVAIDRPADGHGGALVETVRVLVGTVAGGVAAETWLPQVAGLISDMLPIDLAAVDRGIARLLDEIDALAEKPAAATARVSAVSQFVIAASLVTCAELIVLESKRRGREPVLTEFAASTSWSWVLGAATPNRP